MDLGMFAVGEVIVTHKTRGLDMSDNNSHFMGEHIVHFMIASKKSDNVEYVPDVVSEGIIEGLMRVGIITYLKKVIRRDAFRTMVDVRMGYYYKGIVYHWKGEWPLRIIDNMISDDPYIYGRLLYEFKSLGLYKINFLGFGGLVHYIEFRDGERLELVADDNLLIRNRNEVIKRVCKIDDNLKKYLGKQDMWECVNICSLDKSSFEVDTFGDRFFL